MKPVFGPADKSLVLECLGEDDDEDKGEEICLRPKAALCSLRPFRLFGRFGPLPLNKSP